MFPNGTIRTLVKIRDIQSIGTLVRERRRAQGATQAELAALAGVGPRFVGELERGKGTLEICKVLKVLERLGLVVDISGRGDMPR